MLVLSNFCLSMNKTTVGCHKDIQDHIKGLTHLYAVGGKDVLASIK